MHTIAAKESYEITLPSGAVYKATLDPETALTVEGLEECVKIFPSNAPLATDIPALNVWLLKIGCEVAKFRDREMVVTLDNNGRTELWNCNPGGTHSRLMRE
jgi:hypothetical protein